MATEVAKNINLEESWLQVLQPEFAKPYFAGLKNFLLDEKSKYAVFPPGSQVFAALNLTPFNSVKVVILGQDPYHGAGQAHGLCFSVPKGIKPPPSLVNIFKEIQEDMGVKMPVNNGFLENWAKQGVLLLNATLTVRANMAGSHQNRGWETFTDKIISELSARRQNLVFLLWGRYAQNKEALVDGSRHLILKAAHPSPFSAYNGFFGCKHFSKANQYLQEHNMEPIDWAIK